jgi:DNA-binding NarL/FixJ family response regulator
MRSALRTCLDAEPDIAVVGEAADGMETVRMTQRLRPDVVVMDVRMPIMDGIEATRRVVPQDGGRPTRVLVMTTFDLDEHIIDALRAGASGFLVKDAPPEDLIRAVRIIAAGEAVLAPSVTRRLLELRAGTLTPMPSATRDAALAALTVRERTVLRLVARGLPNAEIARAMDVAQSSVKTHIGHLFAKLGLTDRVQLVVFAYEHELVRPGSPEPEPSGDRPPYLLPAPRTRTW